MGRAPCCDKASVKKGPWSPEEDAKLKDYIEKNGTGGNWIALPQKIGLKRCGKSCRLRWLNYLRPNIKHGDFSDEEDLLICALYVTIGSRWSIIAGKLPGRTDNDIKNYWNTRLKKKLFGKIGKLPRRDYPNNDEQDMAAAANSSALERMQLHMQLIQAGMQNPLMMSSGPEDPKVLPALQLPMINDISPMIPQAPILAETAGFTDYATGTTADDRMQNYAIDSTKLLGFMEHNSTTCPQMLSPDANLQNLANGNWPWDDEVALDHHHHVDEIAAAPSSSSSLNCWPDQPSASSVSDHQLMTMIPDYYILSAAYTSQ